jgi:hypothetical protein
MLELRIVDLLPDVRLHAFGQCGHWVMIETPVGWVDYDQLIV